MAIADTVWGRLGRFNAPDRNRRGSGHFRRMRRRAPATMLRWLRIVIYWLLTAIATVLDSAEAAALRLVPYLVAGARGLALCAWWLARGSAAVVFEFALLGFVLLLSIGALLRYTWRPTVWLTPD